MKLRDADDSTIHRYLLTLAELLDAVGDNLATNTTTKVSQDENKEWWCTVSLKRLSLSDLGTIYAVMSKFGETKAGELPRTIGYDIFITDDEKEVKEWFAEAVKGLGYQAAA